VIITFREFTEPLLMGIKTVTRRDWVDSHARKFREGTTIQAYDKSPRNQGKQVATLIVMSLTSERTGRMTVSDWEAEGFRYLWETYLREDYSPKAFEAWRRADQPLWVVRFEMVESVPVDEWLRANVATPMQTPGVSA
jgi:uncharacterized protein YqfB (UPF0267 family)